MAQHRQQKKYKLMTSVLLVEDHIKLGQMIARLLDEKENIAMWAIVHTAEAALDILRALKEGDALPDLVLVDNALPHMNGVELIAELQRHLPNLPCLMLSGHVNSLSIKQSLDAGSSGYVAKEDAFALGDAVRQVLGGEVFLSDMARIALAAG
jgi:DNA-binding NarL/FixJ family response regulator